MKDTFWFNNPQILFDKNHITEIFPQGKTLSSKLNSVTRIVILLTILGFAFTKSYKILISSILTLCAIIIIYKLKKKEILKKKLDKKVVKEGFSNLKVDDKLEKRFTTPTDKNPLMNVLLTEIQDDPKRKPAAPSFSPNVEKKINETAKNIGEDPRLFLDLGDNINFEHSMQRFYTTANSRVGNDQTAFAKFCYGEMPSCKEGDSLQCTKNNSRWINY